MRKIKEVLRLQALGLSQRQIALSCAVGQATVSEYLKAAATASLKWADVADWDDERLWKAVAPSEETPRSRIHPPEPDYAAILHELQTHKHVTLQLLWEEYRAQSPDGYRYSRYCDLYRGWLRRQQVVLRHEHRAGEKLFVDYAGTTIPIHNAGTGEVWPAALFVAVLGASGSVCRRVGRQQLYLCRSNLVPGTGRLDRRTYARVRVYGRRARDRGTGQSEVRCDQGLPV